jgi:hypothetical protein
VELFIDPDIHYPALKVAKILLKKKLGFRYLMDVVPLNADLIKGSHGRPTDDLGQAPVFITSEPSLVDGKTVPATGVKDLILKHLFAK